MAITKNAKKAHRASIRKKVFNTRRSRNVRDSVKEVEKLIKAGNASEAQAKLPSAYKALDKAAKMNTIKKNTASRKKSRLSAAIKKAKEVK